MYHDTTSRRSNPKSSHAIGGRTVCVVDASTSGYESCRQMVDTRDANIRVVTSAAAALRLARAEKIDAWVVNTVLPDLAGDELCAMLKSQHAAPLVCLVADEYTAEAERAAWRARATLFLCKPAHTNWLAEWLDARSSHAVPEGTRSSARSAAAS